MTDAGEDLVARLDHAEALRIANIWQDSSNMSRCYIELTARAAAMVKVVEAAKHAPLIEHDGIVTTCLCCKNNNARASVLKHKTGCLMLALAALSAEPDAGP